MGLSQSKLIHEIGLKFIYTRIDSEVEYNKEISVKIVKYKDVSV